MRRSICVLAAADFLGLIAMVAAAFEPLVILRVTASLIAEKVEVVDGILVFVKILTVVKGDGHRTILFIMVVALEVEGAGCRRKTDEAEKNH